MSEQLKITSVPVAYVPVKNELATAASEPSDDFGKYTEVRNVYVLTPEQLLELRKKWAEEDFSAGISWCDRVLSATSKSGYAPDKTSYINNLTIE